MEDRLTDGGRGFLRVEGRSMSASDGRVILGRPGKDRWGRERNGSAELARWALH